MQLGAATAGWAQAASDGFGGDVGGDGAARAQPPTAAIGAATPGIPGAEAQGAAVGQCSGADLPPAVPLAEDAGRVVVVDAG